MSVQRRTGTPGGRVLSDSQFKAQGNIDASTDQADGRYQGPVLNEWLSWGPPAGYKAEVVEVSGSLMSVGEDKAANPTEYFHLIAELTTEDAIGINPEAFEWGPGADGATFVHEEDFGGLEGVSAMGLFPHFDDNVTNTVHAGYAAEAEIDFRPDEPLMLHYPGQLALNVLVKSRGQAGNTANNFLAGDLEVAYILHEQD